MPGGLQFSRQLSDQFRMIDCQILFFMRIGCQVKQLRRSVVHGVYKCVSILGAFVAQDELPFSFDAPAVLQRHFVIVEDRNVVRITFAAE